MVRIREDLHRDRDIDRNISKGTGRETIKYEDAPRIRANAELKVCDALLLHTAAMAESELTEHAWVSQAMPAGQGVLKVLQGTSIEQVCHPHHAGQD